MAEIGPMSCAEIGPISVPRWTRSGRYRCRDGRDRAEIGPMSFGYLGLHSIFGNRITPPVILDDTKVTCHWRILYRYGALKIICPRVSGLRT